MVGRRSRRGSKYNHTQCKQNEVMSLYVASLTVLVDPNPSPPEYQTIEKTAATAEDAKIALANELHQTCFGTAISEDKEENYHEYSTPLGFLECCRRGDERHESYTASAMWDALSEAYTTLKVEKQENSEDKDTEHKVEGSVCGNGDGQEKSPTTMSLKEKDTKSTTESKKRKAGNISSASPSNQD